MEDAHHHRRHRGEAGEHLNQESLQEVHFGCQPPTPNREDEIRYDVHQKVQRDVEENDQGAERDGFGQKEPVYHRERHIDQRHEAVDADLSFRLTLTVVRPKSIEVASQERRPWNRTACQFDIAVVTMNPEGGRQCSLKQGSAFGASEHGHERLSEAEENVLAVQNCIETQTEALKGRFSLADRQEALNRRRSLRGSLR